MGQDLRGIRRSLGRTLLRDNATRKKSALAIILFLALTLSLAFVVQPAKAASLSILSHSGYLDSVGSYWVFGEVQNLDAQAVGYTQITASFYDSSDNFINNETGYAGMHCLLANHKSPFAVLLSNGTQGSRVDHYTLTATSMQYVNPITFDAQEPTFGLKILSSTTQLDEIGWMNITGNIENTGAATATYTSVMVTCYDAEGKVVAVNDFSPTISQIAPGETVPFKISSIWSDRVPLMKSYVLTAESYEYESAEYPAQPVPVVTPAVSVTPSPQVSPTVTSEPTSTPTPTASPTPTPPQRQQPPLRQLKRLCGFLHLKTRLPQPW
jgi:hypothetical protein